jgi:hypothetical protein
MGVESNFYILPDNSRFRPSAVQVRELITRFRAASYLCDPHAPSFVPAMHQCRLPPNASADFEGFRWQIGREKGAGTLPELEKRLAQYADSDIRLRWRTSDLAKSGLKYPLSNLPAPDEVYYDVEIHLASDTVYQTSEIIEPFAETLYCDCGATLACQDSADHDIFCCERLPNDCSACLKATDYSKLPMTFRDGWTGEEIQGAGGLTYRFCVMINCGKMIPEQGTIVVPEFRHIIEQCLQCHTRVVQDFY